MKAWQHRSGVPWTYRTWSTYVVEDRGVLTLRDVATGVIRAREEDCQFSGDQQWLPGLLPTSIEVPLSNIPWVIPEYMKVSEGL